MRLILSHMKIDGGMAGSGSAADPLFWAADGVVERWFQRAMFEDVLPNKIYVTSSQTGSDYQGHRAARHSQFSGKKNLHVKTKQ